MENKKVTMCLELLFKKLSESDEDESVSTEYGDIQKEVDGENEYFDFRSDSLPYKGIACMDGETCEVIEETEQYVVLQEPDEQIPFKLSREEFDIAAVEYH